MISVSLNGAVKAESVNSFSMEYPCSTNDCHPFEVFVKPGRYFIECWGASGSASISSYVRGSYTSGIIRFSTPKTLYFYIGNVGVLNGQGSFNGGGYGSPWGHSGGGSTDVRLIGGHYSSFSSLLSRIMVSGGGAGLNAYTEGGANSFLECGKGNGGGEIGECGYIIYSILDNNVTFSYGGSQTSGGLGSFCAQGTCNYASSPTRDGKFGIGGNSSALYGSGGGGGYFGGGGGALNSYIVSSGGGGSSYVSGHSDCIAMENSSVPGNLIQSLNSVHYSGLYFTNSHMIGGNQVIPLMNGDTSIGNTGAGSAHIQFIGHIDQYCTNLPGIYLSIHSISLFLILCIIC